MTSTRLLTTLLAGCLGLASLTGCAAKPGATSPSPSATETSQASQTSTPTATETSPEGPTLDLQAHRGGRGEYTEESKAAFAHALDLGVTTLEFDIVLTADGVPVVWHDPIVLESKCSDAPGKSLVGKKVHDLTWQELQTLTCDKKLEGFDEQKPVKGNKMMQLKDVFALTKERGADNVFYNIETKVEGEHRDWSATPEEFVTAIMKEVEAAGVADKVMIQSFDWRTLELVKKSHPKVPTVMLWDETTWKSYSMWTGDVDYDAVGGDILKAAKALKADVLSPGYTVPYGLTPNDPNFLLVANKKFVDAAHKAGLKVVPWTINDPDAMRAQMEAGVDGIITDYPTRLREIMEEEGYALPKPYPAT